MGGTGLENLTKESSQLTKNKEVKATIPNTHDSMRVQNMVQLLQKYPELPIVINAWDRLPEATKEQVIHIVQNNYEGFQWPQSVSIENT